MNRMSTSDLGENGFPISLPGVVRFHSGRTIAEGNFQPVVTSKELREQIAEITGSGPEEFSFPTRVFEWDLRESDTVIVQSAEKGLPLIVRRNGEVIINFDVRPIQAFHFADSKRPIYTYVPGFHIQTVPVAIRRSISNFIQMGSSPKTGDIVKDYRRLPLRSFEFLFLLLNRVLSGDTKSDTRPFHWPSGYRSVFVSFHDVDTRGFLRRKEHSPLFRLEKKHGIRSTWFVPTNLLKGKQTVDFLLQSGNEVGWHGHKHDHRLPFKPYAEKRVQELNKSFLGEQENYPTGMRTPKILKSNHLFDLLDRHCPALCYDTSFTHGIIPYYLWVNGRETRILEIPITVPTDIGVYYKVHSAPRSRKFETILEAQIARTRKIIEVGGIISIVTHPESDLTERPEFLDIYDRYLSFIKGCPDIWFATAGELFKYWTRNPSGDEVYTE